MRSKTAAEAEQGMPELIYESRCQLFVDYVLSLYDQQKVNRFVFAITLSNFYQF